MNWRTASGLLKRSTLIRQRLQHKTHNTTLCSSRSWRWLSQGTQQPPHARQKGANESPSTASKSRSARFASDPFLQNLEHYLLKNLANKEVAPTTETSSERPEPPTPVVTTARQHRDTSNSTRNTATQTTTNISAQKARQLVAEETSTSKFDLDHLSIFDAFPVPKPAEERSPRAFRGEVCKEYLQIIQRVVQDDGKFRQVGRSNGKQLKREEADVVSAWLQSVEPARVEVDLPTFTRLLSATADASLVEDSALGDAMKEEVKVQRKRFCEAMGFSAKQVASALGAIGKAINICAKNARGLPSEAIWQKVKEAGITDQGVLRNLLYVAATFTMGMPRRRTTRYSRLLGASILDVLEPDATPDENSEETAFELADEIAIYHDLLHEPTEQTISIRVRVLVSNGRAEEAEKLLELNSSEADLRLRAYTPVLRLYLEKREVGSALKLYKKMKSMPLVHLESETYMYLLTGLAESGCFCHDAPPIDGAEQVGYHPTSGPLLLDQILTDMAREIFEIPTVSAKRLYDAFSKGFPHSSLETTDSLLPLRLSSTQAERGELVVSRVQIDPSTGRCPRTGVNLRLITLSEADIEKLKASILSLARSGQEKHKKTSQVDSMKDFLHWMDTREGPAFTAIVDGANVGYHMQNYEKGRFRLQQIQFMLNALEKAGETPLAILPFKYSKDLFHTTIGASGVSGSPIQSITAKEAAIRRDLVKAGKLVFVPPSNLDDYYYFLASASEQTVARNGENLNVPSENAEGRWPGIRPIIVSNDQMRDHKVALQEPMLFRRWFSNYIVNYNFAGFTDDGSPNDEIGFSAADFFSREIQCNTTEDGSSVWHFPLAEKTDEWLCVKLPKSDEGHT